MKNPELYVPAITPFSADFSVDTERFVRHARWLIEQGAHGLAPFGTTSEANSMSVAERKASLEALIDGGIGAEQLIPGTGCAALTDTVELTRHVVEAGCKGVLMLPPFYYKGVPEEGVFAAYRHVIETVGSTRLKLYLYHIPQMSGVPITLSLIGRLIKAYPGVVAGLKDSSGDWENTRSVIEAFPEIDVYSASESLIPVNVRAGGAGCISASANINPAGIRALIDGLETDGEEALLKAAARIRDLSSAIPLIPGVKAVAAQLHGDGELARLRPPYVSLGQEHAAQVEEIADLCRKAQRVG